MGVKRSCIYLDFKIDEIIIGWNYIDESHRKSYILNNVIFQKYSDDSYYILEKSKYTVNDIELLRKECMLAYYYHFNAFDEFLYTGYYTNRLGFDHLIKPNNNNNQLSLFEMNEVQLTIVQKEGE